MKENIELKIEEGEKQLTFRIKPMDAFKAEAWLMQAGLLIGKEFSSISNMKDTKSLIRALCSVGYKDARPLLDDLLACCYCVKGNFEKKMTEAGADALIGSPMTLLKLRLESAKANFGFLLDGNLLNSLADTGTNTVSNA